MSAGIWANLWVPVDSCISIVPLRLYLHRSPSRWLKNTTTPHCANDKLTMCKTDSEFSQKAQVFYGQHMWYTRRLTFSIFTTQYHCVRIIMPCSLGDYKTTPCLVITIQPCKLNLNGKYMQILAINLGQQLLQHWKHPDPGDCRYASTIFHSEW